jgi:lysozyme family protein
MADFKISSEIVNKHEGRYNNNANDTGNYVKGVFIGTMYGISAPVLNVWRGGNANNLVIDKDDMINLSYNEALKIYKKNYWDAIGGDRINNQSIANIVYDSAVNQGVGGMKRIYKNATGETYSADSINNYNQEKLFNQFKNARINSYDKSNRTFYDGWMKRVNSFIYEAGKKTVKAGLFVRKNVIPITLISVGMAAIIGTIIFITIKNKIK